MGSEASAEMSLTAAQTPLMLAKRRGETKIVSALTRNGATSETPDELKTVTQSSRVAPVHPEDSRIRDVTHIQWADKPRAARAHARNAVFYGDKAIDRSPCGTGTSARMAQLHAKGRLKAGDEFVHESIIGSLFRGRVEKEVSVGNRPAIIPSIGGWARQTGFNTIFIDDRDPFAHGFVVK